MFVEWFPVTIHQLGSKCNGIRVGIPELKLIPVTDNVTRSNWDQTELSKKPRLDRDLTELLKKWTRFDRDLTELFNEVNPTQPTPKIVQPGVDRGPENVGRITGRSRIWLDRNPLLITIKQVHNSINRIALDKAPGLHYRELKSTFPIIKCHLQTLPKASQHQC